MIGVHILSEVVKWCRFHEMIGVHLLLVGTSIYA